MIDFSQLHSVTKYPYIDNINNGELLIDNTIKGIGDTSGAPYYVYAWVELPDDFEINENSALISNPDNPNLLVILYNEEILNGDVHLLPIPYLKDGSVNPVYAVKDTITDDWDSDTNQQYVLNNDENTIFHQLKEDEYVPTVNEWILILGKLDTIIKSMRKAGGNPNYNTLFGWSSTYNLMVDGDPGVCYARVAPFDSGVRWCGDPGDGFPLVPLSRHKNIK